MQDLRSYICEHTKEDLIDKIQSLDMSPEWIDDIMDELDTSPQMKEAFKKACEDKGLKIPDINSIFAIIKDTKDKSLMGQLVVDATYEVEKFIDPKNIKQNIYDTFIDLGIESDTAAALSQLDISKSNNGAGKFEALLLCCLKDVKHGDQNQADIVSNDGKYAIEVKVNNSRIGGTEKTAAESVRFLEKMLWRKYNIDADIPDDFFVKESDVDWTEIKKSMSDDDLFDLLLQSMLVQYIHIKKNEVVDNAIKQDVITSQGVDIQALFKLRFALALKNYTTKKDLTHIIAIDNKGAYRFYTKDFLTNIKLIYDDKTISIKRQGDTGKNERSSQQMTFNFPTRG